MVIFPIGPVVKTTTTIFATYNLQQTMLERQKRAIFRIGTARYAEGLWRMRRHGPVIAHCTDSDDFPRKDLISYRKVDNVYC